MKAKKGERLTLRKNIKGYESAIQSALEGFNGMCGHIPADVEILDFLRSGGVVISYKIHGYFEFIGKISMNCLVTGILEQNGITYNLKSYSKAMQTGRKNKARA